MTVETGFLHTFDDATYILCASRSGGRPLAFLTSEARVDVPEIIEGISALDISIGVTLEPGFVNAPKRHRELNVPWYIRHSTKPEARSPRVKAPTIVVTCRCGTDTAVVRLGQLNRDIATLDEAGRRASLETARAWTERPNVRPIIDDDALAEEEARIDRAILRRRG